MQKADLTCWQGWETNPRPAELVSQSHCTAAPTALTLWATEAGIWGSLSPAKFGYDRCSSFCKPPAHRCPQQRRRQRQRWQTGPLWLHGMGPIRLCLRVFSRLSWRSLWDVASPQQAYGDGCYKLCQGFQVRSHHYQAIMPFPFPSPLFSPSLSSPLFLSPPFPSSPVLFPPLTPIDIKYCHNAIIFGNKTSSDK